MSKKLEVTLEKIIGWFILGTAMAFLILFTMYGDIGSNIAKEKFIVNGILDKEAWVWGLGQFIAIMSAVSYLIDLSIEFIFPEKKKGRKR
jgi:hypothetical protein